jgi:hypothetical protein
MDDHYCEVDVLKKEVAEKAPHVDKAIIDKIFHIMTYEGNKVIK